MKYLLLTVWVAASVPAFAAIEFSEEVGQFVSASTGSAATSSEAPASAEKVAPSIRSAGNAMASNAAVTYAQSTGVVGNMNGPLAAAGLGATGMLGGDGVLNGNAEEAEGSDDLLAEAMGEQVGGDTSSLMVDAPPNEVYAMPEPGTAVVWVLLAISGCAFGLYRKRR